MHEDERAPYDPMPHGPAEVGVGPWEGAWPAGEQYDAELLREGDRRNVVDRYRYWTIEAIVADLDTRRHDFHVAIENWQHDFNIGTIVRTANAFLAAEVHIVGNRRWNRRGAMVTDRYQHVRHHATSPTWRRTCTRSRSRCACSASTTCPARRTWRRWRCRAGSASSSARRGPGCPTARARGLRRRRFSIAQFGSTRSINASSAAAIAMHTWIRSTPTCPARRPGGVDPGVTATADRSGHGSSRFGRWGGDPPVATRVGNDVLDPVLEEKSCPSPPLRCTPRCSTRPRTRRFAFPAINVSSSQTLNAALQGFAEAGSDGIIQVSTGGAEYLSGPTVKDMVAGSLAFAAFAAEVAKNYPVNIALHTDHCPKDKLDGFVRPLLDISAERVARGEAPLFQSHMWDGSAVPLEENLQIAEELLAACAAAQIILEIEIGVVGGEEDGVAGAINDQLYTTPEDALATVEALGTGEKGRYLTALTFGNVHGVYKPGNVKLRPEILKTRPGGGRRRARPRRRRRSRSTWSSTAARARRAEEIGEAVDYGVVKMNVDTDTQYAFTRPVAAHMFANYDGVLKVDGEVGNKKAYDPRAWGKAAEAGMAARVVEACENLRSAGTSLGI